MFPRSLCAWSTALTALIAFLAGCGPPNPATSSSGEKTRSIPQLTVLVVDDPALGDKIKSEWRSHTEEEVSIRQITGKEIAGASRLPGDLIVFPAGQLGELAEAGLLAPISERTLENDAFALRDIYKNLRLREMKWGEKVMALPLGSPQLVLVYRADIFEKLKIEPPQTWTEYDALAVRLANRAELGDLAPAADVPWRGAAVPLAPGYAGQLLLARSAAYAGHKEQISPLLELTTLKGLVHQPPYEKALTEMAAAEKLNGTLPPLNPAEAYREICQGHCAMAITWPTSAIKVATATDKSQTLGFAELPGAREVYDFGGQKWQERGADEETRVPLLAVSGRMVSVTSTSSEQTAAENMAAWLVGSEVAAQISPANPNTTLFRISQEPDAGQWMGNVSENGKRQYVAVLRQSQERPQFSLGIRLPGRLDYLAALDQAVLDALQGKKSPEESLAAAAAAWDKITAARGLESQKVALERSLGLKKE